MAHSPRLKSIAARVDAFVVGASAGGIEALSDILPYLGEQAPRPVIVVVHLPSDAASLLVPIFRAKCAHAVVEVEDKCSIAASTIYFGPPDYHLLVERDRTLALSVDAPVHHSRPSIDVLFESAAFAYADRVAGVVLSGANEDGADGLAAIARIGGITIVQDPNTAIVPEMPRAALRASNANFVASAAEISVLMGGFPSVGGMR
ncbi:MAG: chemotaxis protein CheB [Polyangiales bacterium]